MAPTTFPRGRKQIAEVPTKPRLAFCSESCHSPMLQVVASFAVELRVGSDVESWRVQVRVHLCEAVSRCPKTCRA